MACRVKPGNDDGEAYFPATRGYVPGASIVCAAA